MHKSFERVRQEKTPEFKSVPFFATKIDERTVSGIFSVFGNIDSYGDVVMPGSFEKTIAERGTKILHLWQHDFMSPPTAKITSIREVGRNDLPQDTLAAFSEATGGAEVTREYFDTSRGNEVLTIIKSGAPLQMSYGYDAVGYSFQEQNGQQIRLLTEQRLWETSDVLWGANTATTASKMPFETLIEQLKAFLHEFETAAGNRHSEADYKLIDSLHDMAAKLGARTCKGVLDDTSSDDTSKSTQSRAEQSSLTLIQMRQRQLASALAYFGEN